MPLASVQATNSCQFSPAPASTTTERALCETTRRPMISTLSTSACRSCVSTTLLPPPSTSLGIVPSAGSARAQKTSSALFTRSKRRAMAGSPKVL